MLPKEKHRIWSLDLLRAFAILSVLLLHASYIVPTDNNPLKQIMLFGWIGVDLFFVLSGYLVSSQIYEHDGPINISFLRTFWIKRWTRTLPLYYFILSLYFFIKPLLIGSSKLNIWYLFFLQNFFKIEDFHQSWSLCIEEQFYLFLPLIFIIFRKQSKSLGIYLILLSIILRWIKYNQVGSFASPLEFDHEIRFNPFYHLDGLGLGIFLAATKKSWQKWTISKVKLFFWGLGFIVIPCFLWGPYAQGLGIIFSFTLLSLGFSLLLVATYNIDISSGIFRSLIEKIAIYSYGAYLWNNMLISSFQRLTLSTSPWLCFIAFFAATFILAAITYQTIEVWGLNLRKWKFLNLTGKK